MTGNRQSSQPTSSNRANIRPTIRQIQRFWFLNCCVSPQSDIGRIRIDRSLIGKPTDFRHLGHMGADDLSGSYNAEAAHSLLSSKGDDEFRIPVPANFRANDLPIKVSQ
ncbi:CDC42 small effector protein 2 [Ditylenchus destructor]|nr:CDC42 small effector protein 2 [Ditylenchus destructor]